MKRQHRFNLRPGFSPAVKNISCGLMCFALCFYAPSLFAQQNDSLKKDTALIKKNNPLTIFAKDSLKKDTSPFAKKNNKAFFAHDTILQGQSLSQKDSAALAVMALLHEDSLRQDSVVRSNNLLLKSADSITASQLQYQTQDALYTSWLKGLLINNRFFLHTNKHIADPDKFRESISQDYLFYLLAGVILLLALIRLSYYKYFGNIFRAFFRPTLTNRQLKDQLLQVSYPALLLNLFFCISLGIYLFLLLRYFHYIVSYNGLLLIAVLVLLMLIIYLVKYFLLRISGWLFGNNELAASYIFIFFLLNKIAGILLVPFILLLAFSAPEIAGAAFYLSVIIIALLLAYRYIRLYGLIRNYIFFSRFHFFLYLCAFEIAPVLIIGRVLLIWLNGNA